MSAHDQMRTMIDQLMGSESNGRDVGNKIKFTNSKVCKPFLLGCCAHEIFEATRMSIGACHRIHEVRLRADYEKAIAKKDYGYDIEVKNYLKSVLSDRDRRTESYKLKLAENQENAIPSLSEKEKVVKELKSQIEEKLAEAERLGKEGLVEESLIAMEEFGALSKKMEVAEQECRAAVTTSSYQQHNMRVCEVCTSFLGVQDNDRRLADHFGGKLHMGYIFLQDKFEELQEKLRVKPDENPSSVPASVSDEERRNREMRTRERRRNDQRRERSRDRTRTSSYRSRSRSRENHRGSRSRHSNSGFRKYRN